MIDDTVYLGNTDGLWWLDMADSTWNRVGTGLEGQRVTGFLKSSTGTWYAVGTSVIRTDSVFRNDGSFNRLRDVWDADLYRTTNKNGQWDTVLAPVPGVPFQLGEEGTGISRLHETDNNGTPRLFVMRWGGDTQWGLVYTDDDGATWQNYNRIAGSQGDTGLASYSSDRLITNYAAEDGNGFLYFSYKNSIQVSFDKGENWEWRVGNYRLSTGTSNIRSFYARSYGGFEYFLMGTDVTSGSFWDMGRAKSGKEAARTWDNISAVREIRGWAEYGEEYLFGFTQKNNNGIGLKGGIIMSRNNGDSWIQFTDSIPDSVLTKMSMVHTAGDILFAGDELSNNIWAYDLTTLPDYRRVVFNVLDSSDVGVEDAQVTLGSQTLSASTLGLLTFEFGKDTMNLPYSITKLGFAEFRDTIQILKGDTTITIKMPSEFAIKVIVKDTAGQIVGGVPVELDGNTIPTNSSGEVVFRSLGDPSSALLKVSPLDKNFKIYDSTFAFTAKDTTIEIMLTPKELQVITLDQPLVDVRIDQLPITVSASSNAGQSIRFGVKNDDIVSIGRNNGQITWKDSIGEVTVELNANSTDEFLSAATLSVTFNVLKGNKVVLFTDTVADYRQNEAGAGLNAVSNPSDTVVFTVVSGPATISADGDSVLTGSTFGTVIIEVSSPETAYWNAATPVRDTFEILEPVGIADLPQSATVSVSPNPTSGQIVVEGEGALAVKVSNFIGVEVASASGSSSVVVDLATLPNGAYFVTVTDENGVKVERIVKN